MNNVAHQNRERRWSSCSVILTGHAGIRALQAAHLGRPYATDVLSFAYPPLPSATTWQGEIIVNLDRARAAGPRYQGIAYELALYIAHGAHHLSGADDATRAQQRAMRRIETRWLRAADRRNLIAPLWPESP